MTSGCLRGRWSVLSEVADSALFQPSVRLVFSGQIRIASETRIQRKSFTIGHKFGEKYKEIQFPPHKIFTQKFSKQFWYDVVEFLRNFFVAKQKIILSLRAKIGNNLVMKGSESQFRPKST